MYSVHCWSLCKHSVTTVNDFWSLINDHLRQVIRIARNRPCIWSQSQDGACRWANQSRKPMNQSGRDANEPIRAWNPGKPCGWEVIEWRSLLWCHDWQLFAIRGVQEPILIAFLFPPGWSRDLCPLWYLWCKWFPYSTQWTGSKTSY